jgi:hypothetical protein
MKNAHSPRHAQQNALFGAGFRDGSVALLTGCAGVKAPPKECHNRTGWTTRSWCHRVHAVALETTAVGISTGAANPTMGGAIGWVLASPRKS